MIFSTTIDMTGPLRQVAAEGWTILGENLIAISTHRRDNVLRFGDYDSTTLHIPPGTYDAAFAPHQPYPRLTSAAHVSRGQPRYGRNG